MDYQIIHAIEGRIRIRIPLLSKNEEYQGKFESQIKSLSFVTDVRINPLAESVIVTYKFKAISLLEMQKNLCQAIEKVLPAEPLSKPSPVREIESFSEKTPEVSEELAKELPVTETEIVEEKSPATSSIESVQEAFVYTPLEVNLEEDPWEDKETNVPKDEIKNEPKEEVSKPFEITVDKDAHSLTSIQTFDNTRLTTSALAKRLHVNVQTLTRYRSKKDFNKWSQAKDPEGVAWNYKKVSKTFYPIEPFSDNSVQPESKDEESEQN
ncbi:MAG: hypothetical protein KME64_21975 [Scytonematopsis contorta HA4267-MV1]|jgi:hypothetical protein|nr:hypothetical protein [Scytonematopsis contorta HA4267-MV1]